MQSTTEVKSQRTAAPGGESLSLGRRGVAVVLFLLLLAALWWGFEFLRSTQRDNSLPKILTGIFAILWGVGGAAAIFFCANYLVEQLPLGARRLLTPFVFVGPAVLLLGWFLFLPTLRTIYLSFFSADSTQFVGLTNYIAAFTERTMLSAFQNNLLWMIFGTAGCVVCGLLIAVLADRSNFENVAKALIFLPMAISFVGAGVIWRFIYYFSPPGQPQIGLLNAIVSGLGGQPQAWTSLVQPWNNFFLIAILVWMQTGFAMVIFSAAIKGIPEDILEAARVDGAQELTIFFQIMIPAIQGTLVTVTTTILILTLKIFDVVIVMTGGQYGTNVIAVEFYRQLFTAGDNGRGSAIAIVLLIAVIPVMVYNLRQLNKQEVF